ncbi:hypothetical protein T02_4273 [Trichinella nativa]|uniref:Uncharacterized protein n=1 Tax=Trichinella nativa TaxID=6335 RepID=A0A0V1KMD8_9BILA|nr:hypothetical protein T02_4273 [Trichinella nativa]
MKVKRGMKGCNGITSSFSSAVTNPMQGESMEMHKVRIISLPPKAVSIQDGMKKLQWNKASLPSIVLVCLCIGIRGISKSISRSRRSGRKRTKLRWSGTGRMDIKVSNRTPTPGQALGGGEESETPPKWERRRV